MYGERFENNAAVPEAVSFSERARQRELASYLSAASMPAALPRTGDPTPKEAVLSTDPNLTALCQLGILRTEADRAFLSLIDGSYQHIIAEATRTVSLTQQGRCFEKENQNYLGVLTMDKQFGVCPNTMELFTDDTGRASIHTDNVDADRSHYFIHDFMADPQCATRPYVVQWPNMRSYAEVPLVSPLGYVIGGYCIVDTKPRKFSQETIWMLSEVAQTIMAHLELVRIKQSHDRSEKLMRGLGSFIEDESGGTLKDFVGIDNTTTSLGSSSKSQSRTSLENNTSSALAITTESQPLPSTGTSNDSLNSHSSSNSVAVQSRASSTPLTSPSTGTFADPFDTQNILPVEAIKPGLSRENSNSKESNIQGTPLGYNVPNDVKTAFTRAADLIRESMSMDGIVFLDACLNSYGTGSHRPVQQENYYSTTSEDEEMAKPVESNAVCTNLAHSWKPKGDNDIPMSKEPEDVAVSEVLLQRIMRRHPHGYVFSADEFGPIVDNYYPSLELRGSSSAKLARGRARHRADITELFNALPGARSVIFLPLWHFQKERWFSCALGWTTDPTKAFNSVDVTYLSAFGNAIMAEVSRFEALAISSAKSDFISSISHELRSPLHGILASAELLHDTLDPFQSSMVDMIESCGSTLLDTMNHLLDFAKINSLANSTRRNSDALTLGTERLQGRKGLTSDVDLSVLVHEVVEGVHLGHASKTAFKSDHASELPSYFPSKPDVLIDEPVLVTLSIENRPSWNVDTEVGAWKRIVANLLGNALKYTNSGYIKVGLRSVTLPNKHGPPKHYICFSVKDSGIGMTAEYMKYRLFTPFAQENSLSVGTGLGLSIVQQIVQNLGGKLDVQSECGVGSDIRVLVPLNNQADTDIIPMGTTINSRALDPEHKLRGRTICFIKPKANRASDEQIAEKDAMRTQVLEKSLVDIAREWLNMRCVSASSVEDVQADIYVVENIFPQGENLNFGSKPTVALCYKRPSRAKCDAAADRVVYLRQPIGPKKLAAAFLEALSTQPRPCPGLQPDTPSSRTTSISTSLPSPQSQNMKDNRISSSSRSPTFASPFSPLSPPPIDDTSSPSVANSTKSRPTSLTHPLILTANQHGESSPPGLHVLLVDDNVINLKILTTYIARLGCTYHTAVNGLEAVQAFMTETRPFDLVFMDVSMPVMNGFDATREIRALEKNRNDKERSEGRERAGTGRCKVIALTGLGSEESRQEAMGCGMDLVLTKPVRMGELRRLVLKETD